MTEEKDISDEPKVTPADTKADIEPTATDETQPTSAPDAEGTTSPADEQKEEKKKEQSFSVQGIL